MSGDQSISRVTRTHAEAQATYDRISRWYDLLEGYWEAKPKARALEMLGVKEGQVVLEIGFGTGHGVLALAEAVGESGRVHGLDLSPRMLALTQARVDTAGYSGRVALRNGDAITLPYGDACFDAIFMSFVLELFDTPEIPQVLSECCRVLKPNGRIAVVSLLAGEQNTMDKLYEWGHEHFPQVLDCRPIFVQRALKAAGFVVEETTLMSLWGLPVEIVIARNTD
jgi:ubiquinone/menaquinone biosynthesis C-methylase UbiE